MFERSIASAEGSQSFTPRPASAAVASTGLVLSVAGAAADVAIELADQLQGEVVGTLERVGVDAVRRVGREVVVGDVTVLVEAGDRRRLDTAQASRHRIAGEAVAQRHRAIAIVLLAVRLGDRVAE